MEAQFEQQVSLVELTCDRAIVVILDEVRVEH